MPRMGVCKFKLSHINPSVSFSKELYAHCLVLVHLRKVIWEWIKPWAFVEIKLKQVSIDKGGQESLAVPAHWDQMLVHLYHVCYNLIKCWVFHSKCCKKAMTFTNKSTLSWCHVGYPFFKSWQTCKYSGYHNTSTFYGPYNM